LEFVGYDYSMMPRLTYSRNATPWTPDWPDNPNNTDTRADPSLFAGRAPFRRLTVLVDANVIPPTDAPLDRDQLLAGFLTHPFVRLLRYADEGPPATVEKRKYGEWTSAHEGWAVIDQVTNEPGLGTIRNVTFADTRTLPCMTGIIGNCDEVARRDGSADCYADLDISAAAARRELDATALKVAEAVHADIFLTARPYLFGTKVKFAPGVTAVQPDDALPLLSLYLRSQGEHLYFRSARTGEYGRMNRGLYYWVGTRELLPASWRWFTASFQHSHNGGDERVAFVGNSLLTRVQRALQARDDVHRAMNRPQDNDTADDALTALDTVLLLLMGAVDAAARVAHVTLSLTSNIVFAGWQRKDWIRDVRRSSPPLASAVADGTDGRNTLTVLSRLRNSVHGEALAPLGVGSSGRRDATLVGLPRDEAAEVVAAIEALGGQNLWGVQSLIPGRLHTDPGILLEQLFPRVIHLLNELMTHTPVEQLSGVNLQPADEIPPPTLWDHLQKGSGSASAGNLVSDHPSQPEYDLLWQAYIARCPFTSRTASASSGTSTTSTPA
jgi:hypothetical protein